MNCPTWRILLHLEGDTDPEAAEHLRNCRSCANLAEELAADVRALRAPPPEVAAVDYGAMRAAARREAARRRRRPIMIAALAAAAVVVLVLIRSSHSGGDNHVAQRPAPVAGFDAASLAQKGSREISTRQARVPARHPHQLKPAPGLDRQFADFLRAEYERKHPAIPPEATPIATGNPEVTIILLESKGDFQ